MQVGVVSNAVSHTEPIEVADETKQLLESHHEVTTLYHILIILTAQMSVIYDTSLRILASYPANWKMRGRKRWQILSAR